MVAALDDLCVSGHARGMTRNLGDPVGGLRTLGPRPEDWAWRILAALALLSLVAPGQARADAGVPMLALVWPASWILFIPVVAIETWVARRIVGLSVGRSVLATAAANATSTLIGIPLVWILLVLINLIVLGGGRALGIDSFWLRVYAVTVQAPWLIPYEEELYWMVPVAAMVLLVPFFFASVFIERLVFRQFCRTQPELARRWSWVANSASYGLQFAVLVALLIGAVARGPRAPWLRGG